MTAPDSLPEFTIAICTRNRAALLARTLDALVCQQGLDAADEILVVDNNSSDSTPQVVSAHVNVRYIHESQTGIAFARNRAASEGHGTWLIYLDDDAVPCPDWLTSLKDCIQHQQPHPLCVIGKVDLEWEQGRPAWFPANYETMLSRYDLGHDGCFLGRKGYLLTTNAAFDRKNLLALGGFRIDLGHRGKSLLGGEDNDMFDRLIAADNPIWYEPRAAVEHWVPRERQTRRWLAKRIFWDGATQPLMDYGPGRSRRFYLRQMGRDLWRIVRITFARWRDPAANYNLVLEWARQIGRFWMNWRLFRQ